jgi:hypothetical protein
MPSLCLCTLTVLSVGPEMSVGEGAVYSEGERLRSVPTDVSIETEGYVRCKRDKLTVLNPKNFVGIVWTRRIQTGTALKILDPRLS